jgi:hypothetical protein
MQQVDDRIRSRSGKMAKTRSAGFSIRLPRGTLRAVALVLGVLKLLGHDLVSWGFIITILLVSVTWRFLLRRLTARMLAAAAKRGMVMPQR